MSSPRRFHLDATRPPWIDLMAPSPAAAARARVLGLRAAGRRILDLSSGDLDFATPPEVVEAARRAMDRGETRYTPADGTPELKEAVRAKFARENGLPYRGDEVIVSNGSTQALYGALLATVVAGDEVVVPFPHWSPCAGQARLAGATPVLAACTESDGFKLKPEALEAAITARTRWLVVNSPANPTGAVYSADETAALAEVLLRHPRVWVLWDALYEHVSFGGRRAVTVAEAEPELLGRTLTVSGWPSRTQ